MSTKEDKKKREQKSSSVHWLKFGNLEVILESYEEFVILL